MPLAAASVSILTQAASYIPFGQLERNVISGDMVCEVSIGGANLKPKTSDD